MNIFVYEHFSAGNFAAASLRAEGGAMLTAFLEDFARIPGVEAHTMRDAADEKSLFMNLAAGADWTLVIAPETDDILPTRLEWVEEAHGRRLGPTPAGARLAGDKLRLAERLRHRSIATPPTEKAEKGDASLFQKEKELRPLFPAVCKPRFGAGSQATCRVHDQAELHLALERGAQPADFIVQPYVPGVAASVAFLLGHGRRLALPPAVQHLSTDGRFQYLGGSLPLPPELAERATRIAARAVDAVEGLSGYVGVDVVLGEQAAGDAVIEINPRPTTSYVGLRALARGNLAAALLAVAAGEEAPPLEWRTGPVCFSADGRLTA